MRTVAVVVALAVTGCMVATPIGTVPELRVQRERTKSTRQLSTVGLVAGIAIGVLGGVLVAQAAGDSASEGREDEWVVPLLVGYGVLLPVGIGLTAYSGNRLWRANREAEAIDARIREVKSEPPPPTENE